MLRGKTLPAALAALLLTAVAVGAGIGTARSDAAAPAPIKPVLELPAAQPGPAVLPEVASPIQRTFVSTSGSDANGCTRAQPCRNFAAAIAQTTAGGELVALDSGGYGPFTIEKAITIVGTPGAHVAITSFGGTAVDVNAGPTDTVVLRNLYLTGLGGAHGIMFRGGGALQVESVVVSGFDGNGLWANIPGAKLIVTDSRFRGNGQGVLVEGGLRVEISDSRADRNGARGFFLYAVGSGGQGSIVRSAATRNGASGFEFWGGAVFALSDSVADGNDGSGVRIEDPGTNVTVTGSVLSNNADAGFQANFLPAAARIGSSTVTANGTGLLQVIGTLESFGDNVVRGNAVDVQGTITPVGKT